MSLSTEQELVLPAAATLSSVQPYSLQTLGGTIQISPETSLRSSSACCLVVGRQANVCDIRIQHSSVSRRHACLYYQDRILHLQDLGGKQGSFVNGERIRGAIVLHDGDTITFGNASQNVFTVVAPTIEELEKLEHDGITKSKSPEIDDGKIEQPAKSNSVYAKSDLSGRAQREAEIAAAMASLDEAPVYEKSSPADSDDEDHEGNGREPCDSQDDMAQLAQTHKLPIAHRLEISSKGDRRYVVTCVAIDPAGSRFCVGGSDSCIRLFDFSGMDQQRTTPFKSIQVEDGHIVVDSSYSNTGDRIVVATSGVQPVVFDRDGHQTIKFIRGDMYVNDQARTSGHTASVTSVAWHPLLKDVVLTSSLDGSARLWNLNGKTQFQMLVCDKVYQAKNERGQRTAVTTVAFHPGGRRFALGTSCGSIQIWNATKLSARPDRSLFHAHGKGNQVHNLTFNLDGTRLASRSMNDDKVQIWNPELISRSSSPIAICAGVPSVHEHSNSAFGPNSDILCTGTSDHYKQDEQRLERGTLKFFLLSIDKGNSLLDLPISERSGVVIVNWHLRLNQIFVGCSDGSTVVFFDLHFSVKGALLSAGKAIRSIDPISELIKERSHHGLATATGAILTPNALPLYRDEERVTKRKRDKDRMDPIKSRRPEPPATGIKTGGQNSASVNFTQFVADATGKTRKKMAGVDPREELFRYLDGKKYTGDGPAILAEKTIEEEEEQSKSKK